MKRLAAVALTAAACCLSAAVGGDKKIEVACVYYPHWHEYPKGNEWFHKGFNEWEFVKDARPRVPGQKVPLRPLYGFLDGKNPDDVAKEIDLASNAGIDVFLFDWYWYGGEMTMQESLEQGFLRAPNRMKMKFCLMWCYHDRVDSFRDDPRAPKRMLMKLPRTPEDFLNNIRYAKKFFHEPNHWMRDGKPFFSIYSAPRFVQDMGGPEKTRQLLDEARKIAIADGLAGIYFQGMNPQNAKDAKMLSDAGFDCIGSYNLATCPAAVACEKNGTFTFDYSEMLPWHQECWKKYSAGATVPYIPAVTAGRDVTMRCRNEEPFPWQTIRYPYGYICLGNTPDKFQSLLEAAKKHVEADPKAPRAILIYGWNEYTEGGYIAPNNFDADGALRAVAAVFGRKPASEYTYVNPSTKQLFTIPSATYENIPYGPHPKQKIDVFLPGRARAPRAPQGTQLSAPRAPVVIYLHGGGWSGGAMEDHILGSSIRMLLDRGIAVVGTGYRYIRDAHADGVKPPVQGCLDDCENALKFVKAHAAEWNLDVSRIGLAGGSAGACTALYLALKDDNALGIRAVAPIIAQTSMDPQEMKAWIPNSHYGAHAFGYRNFDEWLAHRADCLADIERISPAALARKIDPARAPQIFLQYGSPLKPGETARDPTHSPVFGERFKELCAARGISCKVNYGGKAYFGDAFDWLADQLLASGAAAGVPEPQPVKSSVEITALYYPGTEHMPEWDMVKQVVPQARPLLGWYDESDPANVDWQIKWAVEHGISSFCVCWYWNKGEQRLDHWVKAFYRAKFRRHLKWYMMYANHNQPGSHSSEDQAKVTKFWIDNYFNTPEYYRIDGRPVVVYCTASNLDRDFIAEAKARGEDLKPGEGIRRAFDISEKMAKEAGLPGICWINMNWLRSEREWSFTQAHYEMLRRAGFSAEMSYNMGGTTPYYMAPEARKEGDRPRWASYDLMAAAARKLAGHAEDHPDIPFWPTIPTGYDDTSRAFQRAWVVHGRTLEKFRALCAAIKGVCEEKGLKHVVISPINEWQEGSYIEPNEEYGFAMYDALRDVFCERPKDGWPRNLTPRDLGMPLREYPPMFFSPVQAWSFDTSTEGWYRQPFGTPVVRWRDGAIRFITTRPDIFHIRQRLVPFDAKRYRLFKVRMRITPNPLAAQGAGPRRMRLKWGTTEEPIIGNCNAVDFEIRIASAVVKPDGEWHEYAIDLSRYTYWGGMVNELWFEGVDLRHATVEIDWMRFEP